MKSNAAGWQTFSPPAGNDHDWVLVLETPRDQKSKGRAKLPLRPDSTSAENEAAQQRRPTENENQLTLSNDQIAWQFDWSDGHLRSSFFENKLSGHHFALSGDQELALVFSAALDHVAQPYLRASDFEVRETHRVDAQHVVFDLRSSILKIDVALHVQLDGATRRKWAEVKNETGKELLLLDVELDDFTTAGLASGGGEGQPVYLEGEVFAAVEHPAGANQANKSRVQLAHYPGKKLAAGATFRSQVALVSVAKAGQVQESFVSYIQSKSIRPKKAISIYSPFGINNLWGPCPTLDDEEILDTLNVLEKWQKLGMHFDYYELDLGWVDPASDLTRFRPTCFPNGPGKIVERLKELNMKFGLWFATSWGTQSAWDYPPAFANGILPGQSWREGSPLGREGINFCIGTEQYHQMMKKAFLHHIKENNVRLFKFDGGDYVCNATDHGHLPGKYSIEPRMDNLIDIADAARAAAPDVFIMWYWGLKSPFWLLHGDLLFESGLQMEGSATSS
ncbi:MAG: hypothetical protein ABJC04_14080, partial [Verrucomicrobiota bacterium]